MKWDYNTRLYRWEATHGTWRAVVARSSDASGRYWYSYVDRLHPPHDRRNGPTSAWAVEGRAWCEATIKQLDHR